MIIEFESIFLLALRDGAFSRFMDYKQSPYAIATLFFTGVLAFGTANANPPFSPDLTQGLGAFEHPGDRMLPPAEFQSDQPPEKFVLPPLKPPSLQEAPLSGQIRVFLRSFRIRGNTVLSPQALKAVTAPYVGRVVSSVELQELRQKLTLLYINHGYINSGVILPDQKVTDGIIVFQAIEGVLSKVDVQGQRRLLPEYTLGQIALDRRTPLNLSDLQEQLQLLKLDPMIERLDAQLLPGDKPGESILNLHIEESSAWQLAFRVNNHRSPATGSMQGEVDATRRNLTGRGDTLNLRYRNTEGSDDGSFGASIPLQPGGMVFSVNYRTGKSEVVEPPFNEIDVESEFKEISVNLSYPLIKRLNRSLDLSLKLETRRSDTFLLGRRFSFSPGVENGKSKVTVIRLIGDWLEHRENQVFSVRSTLSQGIDAFDATINDKMPDGKFLTWLGQFQYARRYGKNNSEVIFRTDVHLTSETLLPLEKFGIGGARSVRGYRENELVRDQGWVSSLEFRFPILRKRPEFGKLQIAAFADFGRSWDKSEFTQFPENISSTPTPGNISSVGLGFRWAPRPKWQMEFLGALPFRNIDHESNALQDSGIHLGITYHAF